MDTAKLKKFAQAARRQLMAQVKAKLALVLAPDSLARRERVEAIEKLEAQIAERGEAQVIEQVAYIWFNRFCALRYMDVKGYNRIGVLSPVEGQFQPEILAEAKGGYVDEDMVKGLVRERVFALLGGTAPSADGQAEAYRLLIVAVCNDYHRIMPYLFQRIDDYTELLMPEDLLSGNSILAVTREAMTPEACQDVEVIGWLYQFYISEKKDEVFAGLKKNKKITPENIPAATQLFTPHWIVRYLVENSLGQLWLLNRPQSGLKAKMDYYIEPVEAETDFLRVGSPEEIKICDPACGSGHMLTYAFDLLYAIYEEEGYAPKEIPEKILTCNLYGIEIDERAGELAAFALTMKAREKQRSFFRGPVQPNICVLENVRFAENELADYMDFVGRDLFTAPLLETLHQFREADNLGSLIRPVVTDVGEVLSLLEGKDVEGQLFLYPVHQKVLKVLRQADYLSPTYQVVVANPPYMGRKNMNPRLQSLVTEDFQDSCSDLFATFIERSLQIKRVGGHVAMVTMDSWMFGEEYTNFREEILSHSDLDGLLHLGSHAFDEIKGEVVQVVAFIFRNKTGNKRCRAFFDVTDQQNSSDKERFFLHRMGRYDISVSDLKGLPRGVVAYFASSHTKKAFKEGVPLKNICEAFTGLQTGDNPTFIRAWSEISFCKIDFSTTPESASQNKSYKWVPYVKGSNFRKWYGNQEFVLNWQHDGAAIKAHKSSTVRNSQYYFRRGLAYNTISSRLCLRMVEEGFVFDQKNSMFFSDCERDSQFTISFLNSKVVRPFLRVLAPKDFGPGAMKMLPVIPNYKEFYSVTQSARSAIDIAQADWNAYEISWDFKFLPLLSCDYKHPTLKETYKSLRGFWNERTIEMQRIEEENNRLFIDAYDLNEELTSEIPLEEITLTCNPAYHYRRKTTADEFEKRLLADTMREFISYAVGCMFGRYSLDKPGLILANQGETLTDYLTQIPHPTFPADKDNVIPILDGDWFPDDITERFYTFLRTTFGEEHYTENLKFLEEGLGQGKRLDVRKYFLTSFYKDHLKRYKKRPIYWLFSSPSGTFNALIYLHRYRPDTVSIILNDYLREFQTKLAARKAQREQISISASATNTDKTKALKDIDKLNKQILELEDYERDILYPLATQQIEIDLDDGVKVNYPKFGKALKKVPGLS